MIYTPKPKIGIQLNTKHPLSKGLISCLLLNEKTGDKIFNSAIGNDHCTNIGADWIPEGLYFDGADRVSVPKVLIGNNDAFTICSRFNGAAGGIVYGEGYSGSAIWALFLGIEPNPPYSARFFIKELDVWKALTVGTTPVNDGWHSVCISQRNKNSRAIYIDGKLEGTNTDTVGDMSILDRANIGVLERTTFGSYFTGGINQVYIHNRGIAGAEAKLYSRDPYAIFRQPEQLLRYASFVPIEYTLIAASGQYGLTGQTVGLDKSSKIVAGTGSFVVTGNESWLLKGYPLNPESGLFAISGQDIEFKKDSKLLIDSGDYNISGNDADLLKSNLILPVSGSYGLTGKDVEFISGYAIIAGSGAYALTGPDLNLLHSYRLDTDSGSFEISGQNVSLLKGSKLSPESGIYNITGQSTSLIKGFLLELEPGIYNLTGNPVEFVVGYMTIAGSGVYGLTGNPVELLHSHIITADLGGYNISGNEINLLKGLMIDISGGIYAISGQDVTLIYTSNFGCLKMVFISNQPIITFADISNQPTIVFTDMC